MSVVAGHGSSVTDAAQMQNALGQLLQNQTKRNAKQSKVVAKQEEYVDLTEEVEEEEEGEEGEEVDLTSVEDVNFDRLNAVGLMWNGGFEHVAHHDPEATFLLSAADGKVDDVSKLINSGRISHVDAVKDYDGRTALILAAMQGHAIVVKYLIDTFHASVDAVDMSDGRTALLHASSFGHTETVIALAARGANVDARGKKGETALMLAVFYGHADTAITLKQKHNAAVVEDPYGNTALTLARTRGLTNVVRALES